VRHIPSLCPYNFVYSLPSISCVFPDVRSSRLGKGVAGVRAQVRAQAVAEEE